MRMIFFKSGTTVAVFLAVAVSAITVPRFAAAQTKPSAVDMAQARELFNEGLDLRAKGDLASAIERLAGANALAHTPIIGLELGRTYSAVGKLVEAREVFLSIARIPDRPEETGKSKAARKDGDQAAEQLRARIPSLKVKITGVAPESVAVTIDGASVPTEALAGPRLVDPGSHTVSARSTSGGTAETQIELKEGETREVELKIVFSPNAQPFRAPIPPISASANLSGGTILPSHADETPAGAPRSREVEWTLIAGGAAVALGGVVVMGVEASQAQDAITNLHRSSFDSAKTGWTVGLVGTIVGGLTLATGVVALLGTEGHTHSAASMKSIWLGASANDLVLGGTW